ncbi:MAG: hypothetical protein HZB38_13115 [Planctomycetes bacterium]|nr:hypothetical protein [Planctomycetota bacterium]
MESLTHDTSRRRPAAQRLKRLPLLQVGLIAACALVCPTKAFAQYTPGAPGAPAASGYSSPTAQPFTLNAGFGLGGTPILRPQSLVGGNSFATGNVRGGFALRSYSPIADPTAFRGSLGSAGLSNFIRDSVSVYDAYGGGGLPYAPFYDPSRTAPTAGFLSGQAGTIQNPTSRMPNDFVRPRTVPGMLNYTPPGGSTWDLPGQAGTPVTTSSFGVMPIKPIELNPINKPLTKTDWDMNARQRPGAFPSPLADDPAAASGRPDIRVNSQPIAKPIGSPLETVMKGDAKSLLASPPALATPPSISGNENPPTDAPESPVTAALNDVSMLPGRDVFTDMRLALAMVSDPQAVEIFRDMQKRTIPGQARPTGDAAVQEIEAAVFIDRVVKAPLKSFVGRGAEPINDELLKAESLLQLGQYYDAARRYERAALLDPANPLPQIGRGHALLAAGDYLSASLFLVRGLERFPEMAQFRLDLSAFFSSAEVVDIRRADLMKELARQENPTLRFLLGYLEYYTGDREHGMENLEKAAQNAEPGSMIGRYPAMLRGDGVPPAPKLPPAEGPAPAEK